VNGFFNRSAPTSSTQTPVWGNLVIRRGGIWWQRSADSSRGLLEMKY
jgi:hypothetical protein